MRRTERLARGRWSLILILLTVILQASICNSPPPQQRPGTAFDGSIHWARDIALPLIQNFAADAQPYSVLGAQVWSDGRLPANAGTWSIVAWSPSLQKEFQVTIKYDGSTTTDTRDQTSPPSSDGLPIPAGWVNSTVVFQAVTNVIGPISGVATLVVFNIATYTSPVWALNFSSSGTPNQYVRWDGTYLGTSP